MRTTRRNLLGLAAVGTASVLAGCEEFDPVTYLLRFDLDTWVGPITDGDEWLVDGRVEAWLHDPDEVDHEGSYVDGLTDVRVLAVDADGSIVGRAERGAYTIDDATTRDDPAPYVVEDSFTLQTDVPPVRLVLDCAEFDDLCDAGYTVQEYLLPDGHDPGHAGRLASDPWQGRDRDCEDESA
ncbi:hypothetical protein CV102_02395 [Natronococcus pandeyae]|uniref:Uncharacterized protein n=1 Tax=Natronococcus pandeyae TaxID=2055836 RepID=A0A8J8Q8G5_9EURY|nr:hypothetical protein [Natronococcus pandeyae]TYL40443.1 hypothetical protein CV102_02395 [Natronococcus pandeyae]